MRPPLGGFLPSGGRHAAPEHAKELDYQPLLDDDQLSASSEGSPTPSKAHPAHLPRRLDFTLVFNVILTVFNLALALYIWHYIHSLPLKTSFYPVHKLTTADVQSLRRPSQFINLEKMYANRKPQPRKFTNWPIVLAPLDPDVPRKALGDDPKRHRTRVGTISPEDRQVRVTGKVSTIAQFRAIDFMMEYCQLVLKPPPDSVIGTSNVKIDQLYFDLPLQPQELTFANRPSRASGKLLASINVFNGSEWRHTFSCSPDRVFTFELACEEASLCKMDWWQNKEKQDFGLFLVQSSTEFS